MAAGLDVVAVRVEHERAVVRRVVVRANSGRPVVRSTGIEGGAVYALERSARCPHCKELIRSLRVLRLKRTQVSFTSPLPRAGRVMVRASCLAILSADLSAF